MLRNSDIKKPAAAPAKPAPAPAPALTPVLPPATPAFDPAAQVEMQKAVGQLAGTMEKLAWSLATMKPAAPVVGMDADVVRDDKGRMKALRVTFTREE